MIVWLFFGDVVYSTLMRVPLIANIPLLSAIAKLFSLSDILSDAVSAIANGMLSFWQFVLMLG